MESYECDVKFAESGARNRLVNLPQVSLPHNNVFAALSRNKPCKSALFSSLPRFIAPYLPSTKTRDRLSGEERPTHIYTSMMKTMKKQTGESIFDFLYIS